MALCQDCGASYDDTFKFCPHCGRTKTETESIKLNVRVVPVRYEEAVLKIKVVGTAELTEPPFDYRPRGLTRALGEGGKNWTQIAILRLLLESTHPEKGRSSVFKSGTFRGFITPDFKLPDVMYHEFTVGKFSAARQAHKWLLDLFDERHRRWVEFNDYLISGGWAGLTQSATDREAPFTDHPSNLINRDGRLNALFQDWLMATSHRSYLRQVGSRGDTEDLYDFGKSYRYRLSLA